MKKLMVVDDDDMLREITACILEKAGYMVVEAVDGLDALNKLDASEVDMVITDFRMPNMNGAELIEALRTMPAYKRLPIVVMTAAPEDFKRAKEGTAHASDFISKPFLPHQLTEVVARSGIREV